MIHATVHDTWQLDEEGIAWNTAWNITTQAFNYTNHTVLPEALEKWNVSLVEKVIPRHMELIWEVRTCTF
jgi:starch phosphorylase